MIFTKQIAATCLAGFLWLSSAIGQDLTAVSLKADPIPYVTFQAAGVKQLQDLLTQYGLPPALAQKAKRQSGNFYLPLPQVLADSGTNKIWYMTDRPSSVEELAKLLGVEATDLRKRNSFKSEQLNKGRYVLLGYVGTGPEPETTESSLTKQTKAGVPKPLDTAAVDKLLPKASRDSLAGLVAPKTPGYYEAEFAAKGKWQREGRLGLFKSVGGWYDGKFHALCNDLPVGTVVRVENPANGRHVFAKVVSKMPGLAEDKHLVIRLSDAGRAALDVWGDNTEVRVLLTD